MEEAIRRAQGERRVAANQTMKKARVSSMAGGRLPCYYAGGAVAPHAPLPKTPTFWFSPFYPTELEVIHTSAKGTVESSKVIAGLLRWRRGSRVGRGGFVLFSILVWVLKAVAALGGSLLDAMPPYRLIEGRLDAKRKGPQRKFYVRVGSRSVEVDEHTFGMLVVGETLRIRATRRNRAISVDRMRS